jgi:hypothetical protein
MAHRNSVLRSYIKRLARILRPMALTMAAVSCGTSTPTDTSSAFEEWPEPTETYFAYESDSTDFIAEGQSAHHDLTPTVLDVRNGQMDDQAYLQFEPGIPNESWFMRFALPDDVPMGAGNYEGAQRESSADHPGIDVSAFGRGCNTISGDFVIGYLRLDAAGDVTRLHMTFEQHCEGATAALRGEISLVLDP